MIAERRPLIAANWKMNKTVAEAEDFLAQLLGEVDGLGAEVVVCPPATALAAAIAATRESEVEIAAQTMHFEAGGAYTGEISAPMLIELGAWGVILGHSERRQYFCETDEALAKTLPAALEAGLVPILCVGESEAERDAGETEGVLERQLATDLAAVSEGRLSEVVVAYEPIWAIGTGRTATEEQAQDACAFIRSQLERLGPAAAEAVRILYGGSMKPANAAQLLAQPDIDGGLVGGAALDPGDFAAICRAGSG